MSENKANIQSIPRSGSENNPDLPAAAVAGITTGPKAITQRHIDALSAGVWAGRDNPEQGSIQVTDPGGAQAKTFAGFREGLDTYRKRILPTLSQLECLIVLISHGMYGIETQRTVSAVLHRARSMGSLHVDAFIEHFPPSVDMPDGYCRIVVACPDQNSRSLVWNALDGARVGNRNRYVDLFIS